MSTSHHNAPPLSPNDVDIKDKGISLQAAQPQHHLNHTASSQSLSDTKGDPAVASSANSTTLATVDSEGRKLYNGCSIIPMVSCTCFFIACALTDYLTLYTTVEDIVRHALIVLIIFDYSYSDPARFSLPLFSSSAIPAPPSNPTASSYSVSPS